MTQSPVTTHPLVARYLADLESLLDGIEPVERAEVLDGVREHLEATLSGTDRSEADVRAALDEVGPPQAVADEAWAGRPDTRSTPARPPATSRGWVPPVVAVLQALSVLNVLAVGGMSAGVTTTSSVSTSSAGVVTETPVETTFVGDPMTAAFGMFASLPFWLPLVLLVALSALWTPREKTLLIALAPVGALLLGVLPSVGWALFGETGVYGAAWASLAAMVLGGGALTAVLVRRALARRLTRS